jgi:hypothetical protein
MKTYRVVTDALQRFTIPALKLGVLDPEPYVTLAHGDLPQEIEAGRGHCNRILIHYRRLEACETQLRRDSRRLSWTKSTAHSPRSARQMVMRSNE